MSTTVKKSNLTLNYLLKLLSGPAAFFIFAYVIPFPGMEQPAKNVLGIFVWLIIWWCAQPIPWAAACMLPLILLPGLNGMKLAAVASSVYGQRIFFLLIFVFLLGEPIKRYRLGERVAMNILSIKWINGSMNRFALVYEAATCILAGAFGIAGSIIAAPVGAAVLNYTMKEYDKDGTKYHKGKLCAYIVLAGLYGALAGGFATMHAIPHNAMVQSLLEEICGYSTTYFQWSAIGIPLSALFIAVSHLILRFTYKKYVSDIPGGNAYFSQKKAELGAFGREEKRLAVTLSAIIILWASTSFVSFFSIDFYTVSYIGILVMYIVPASLEKKEGLFTIADLKKINWNIILLITTAVGFSGIMQEVGLIAYIGDALSGVSGFALLAIAAFVTPLMTNFLPGMATAVAMSSLIFPLCASAGINPVIIARIIPTMSMGFCVPWAGTLASIFFGTDMLDMKEMIKTGTIVTIILGILALIYAFILIPLTGMYIQL